MLIKSTSAKGNFKLIDRGKTLGELRYTNWFLGKAESRFKGHNLEIKPKSIWGTTYLIFKNNKKIGEIGFSIKGQIRISMMETSTTEQSSIMKRSGFLKPCFRVFNADDECILTLTAVNNWKKLNYDYQVTFNSDANPDTDPDELLLYCGFGMNLYWAHMSAV